MREITRMLKFLYRKSRIKTLFGASFVSFYFKKNRNDIEIHFKHGVALDLLIFQKSDFSLDGFVSKLEAHYVRFNSLLSTPSCIKTYANGYAIKC